MSIKKQHSLGTLITATRMRRLDCEASNGRWHTRWNNGTVQVWHHFTHMISVRDDDTVVPVNPGRGNASDKAGITRILRGAGIPDTYQSIFPEGMMSKLVLIEDEPITGRIKDESAEPIQVFIPPLRADSLVGM